MQCFITLCDATSLYRAVAYNIFRRLEQSPSISLPSNMQWLLIATTFVFVKEKRDNSSLE